MTINASRGINHKIQDRFDLTLECIRRFYSKEISPLTDTFERYHAFFELFGNFQGYTEFFLLEDLVSNNFQKINFWHPFSSFDNSPLPKDFSEYLSFKAKVEEFVANRNNRILKLYN